MTGACGPYNLGGSTTEWYQSDHYKGFCSIVLQKLQNDLGQINITTVGPNCFWLILFHSHHSLFDQKGFVWRSSNLIMPYIITTIVYELWCFCS